jgi:paraquat-inducible protein A
MSIAQLKLGWGLYAFVALIIINTLLTSGLDEELFWQRIEQLRTRKKNAS